MKLLIVDDEKCVRSILSEMAQEWGYEVILAADGESAWKMLEIIYEPMIVLMDWIMPGIDGVTLCQKIKRSAKATYIHVIMLTAKRSDVEDVVTGFDAGADDFLIKPVDSRELSCRLSVGKRILTYQQQLEQQNAALQETTKIMGNILRDLNLANGKLQAISMLDELTGVANRRALEEWLSREWQKALRKKELLTFIMLDVDFFKLYNDTYGHQAGDECLKKIADVLALNAKRGGDFVARYGGEEFVVGLFATDAIGGQQVGENIRLQVESLKIPHKASTISLYVTVSMGIATMIPETNTTYELLLQQADRALYQAKREGRNRWIAASD